MISWRGDGSQRAVVVAEDQQGVGLVLLQYAIGRDDDVADGLRRSAAGRFEKRVRLADRQLA